MRSEHTFATVGHLSGVSHLKSHCLPRLLTRCRRHRWTFCKPGGIQNHKTQYPKNAGHTVRCKVWVVYTADGAADRAAAPCAVQHHQRVWYHISLARARSKFTIQSAVSTECVLFLHIVKLKNLKSNHHKSEIIFCI